MDAIARPETDDLAAKYDLYGNMLFRLCMVLLCNKADAEDAVQDTFLKYMKKHPVFSDTDHEKAWLIRVATNCSRDKRRSFFFKNSVSLDEIGEYAETPEQTEVLEKLMSLPARYKTVLYLHYVEGYKLREIARVSGTTENAVKVALFRGRKKLQLELREEYAE